MWRDLEPPKKVRKAGISRCKSIVVPPLMQLPVVPLLPSISIGQKGQLLQIKQKSTLALFPCPNYPLFLPRAYLLPVEPVSVVLRCVPS